ncbi:phenol hydroxylase [Burkholderia thailandensis]|nr:phenol hydroxylase [Burkholderia thailandensis]
MTFNWNRATRTGHSSALAALLQRACFIPAQMSLLPASHHRAFPVRRESAFSSACIRNCGAA